MSQVIILKSRLAVLGGLERYALYLARAFHQKGCSVTLLTTGPLPLKKENFSILSLHSPLPWGVLSIFKFHLAAKKWVKKHSYDCIFSLDRTPFTTHYRAGNGSHLSYLIARNPKPLHLFLAKCNPKNQLLLFLEKKLFNNPTLQNLYTNSEMVKKELIKQYNIKDEFLKVIHNGVDFASLPLKASYSSTSTTQLLFIGQDYKRKGLDLLLEALSPLKSLAFHLTVIGKDKKQKKYEKHAQKLGLVSKVSFKGPQNNLLADYQKADCFILPTRYDPFANVTLEALAMGLFVITSKFNGAKEIIKNNCGYVLNSLETANELKSLLQKVIEKEIVLPSKEQIRSSIEHLSLETQTRLMVDHALWQNKD